MTSAGAAIVAGVSAGFRSLQHSVDRLATRASAAPEDIGNGLSAYFQKDNIITPALTLSQIAVVAIFAHVVLYNVVAHVEYNTRFFTKCFGKAAVYLNAVFILTTASIRNHLILAAVAANIGKPVMTITLMQGLRTPFVQLFALIAAPQHWLLMALGLLGNVWVFRKLGIVGIFNGDSFGWLFANKVTDGPYRYLEHPQYVATGLYWLGVAIYYQSVVGFYLAVVVCAVFHLSATYVEAPFICDCVCV